MTVLEELCEAIWRHTYRHGTLLEWSDVKPDTVYYKRVVEAANAAYEVMEHLPGRRF